MTAVANQRGKMSSGVVDTGGPAEMQAIQGFRCSAGDLVGTSVSCRLSKNVEERDRDWRTKVPRSVSQRNRRKTRAWSSLLRGL
jgi:hypothetical protein